MNHAYLRMNEGAYQKIWDHLLPVMERRERAGFLFVDIEREDNAIVFGELEWFAIPPEGFVARTARHFELRDSLLAYVIKRAHDLDASIVEMHSHPLSKQACFSPFDQDGFREIVPHVRWRLKGKPYGAIVVARTSFDGLVWLDDDNVPNHIGGIIVDGVTQEPTRLSALLNGDINE